MRIPRCFAPLAMLVASAALAPAAARGEPPGPPPAPGTLTVAMTGSYWPLHDEGLAGERDGLEAELAADLARLLGMKVRFVGRAETGASAIDAVAQGKADVALASITPTDERRRLVDFTKPYLLLRYRMAARAADAAAALEPAGKRIAAPRGPAVAVAKALFPRAALVEVASPDAAVHSVLKGSADLAFGEDVGMVLAVQGRPLGLVGPPLAESPIAMAVARGGVARYDEALGKLSGRIAELIEKYRPGEPPDLPADLYLSFSGGIDPGLVHLVREPLSVAEEGPEGEVEWHPLVTDVQISVPARKAAAPAAVRRRAGDHLHDAATATWVKLPDGTWIGFDQSIEQQQCGGTEIEDGKPVEYSYECPEHHYRLVAVRGDQVGGVKFTLSEGT